MALWSGRFTQQTDSLVQKFSESISYDRRLYPFDIQGSQAHAKMLAKQGIISQDDADKIIAGLNDSRNDQIATDERLYMRHEADDISLHVKEMQRSLVQLAADWPNLIMPGFTHLQHAQPILFAHHLLAYVEMFGRDRERLTDARKRLNRCPLGAGAIAGCTLPLDRKFTAEQLGFDDILHNSMDAVGDRDYIIEFLSALSIIAMHLSRLSEDIILWFSQEFTFIELGDAFTTGSSLMPQKKNPDVAELTRGKTGRVYGHLMAMLTTMKGLPLTYNRDLQEDKEGLFDAIDTVKLTLATMSAMLTTLNGLSNTARRSAKPTAKSAASSLCATRRASS